MTIYLPRKVRARAQPPASETERDRLEARESRIAQREAELSRAEAQLKKDIHSFQDRADEALGRGHGAVRDSAGIAEFILHAGKVRRGEVDDTPFPAGVAGFIVASAMLARGELDPDAPPRSERERAAIAALRLLR